MSEKQLSYESILSSLEEKYSEPRAKDFETIHVDFAPGRLLGKISEVYADEINRIATMLLRAREEYVMSDTLEAYFVTIIWMRIKWCNNQLPKDYRDHRGDYFIPSLVYSMIELIGEVEDAQFGYMLKPILADENLDILPIDEVLEVSRKLRRLEDGGLKGVKGLPRDKEGVLDFMALTLMDDAVMSYRRGRKIVAIYAAMYEKMAIAEAAKMVPRIHYGYRSQYAKDIPNLIADLT